MNSLILIPPQLRERAERYCSLMKRISGVDPLEESRLRPVVMARIMVANALLIDGYSTTEVGTILGLDHSTICYYRDRLQEILTAPGYKAEKDVWEKFSRKI